MKKSLIPLIIGIVIGGLLFYFIQNQAPKAGKPAVTPVEKTSFADVTKKLDSQGTFYMFLSTERAMAAIETFITDVKALALARMKDKEKDSVEAEKTFDFLLTFVRNSGFFDIDGIGMSSIAIDETYDRNVITVHHPKDKGAGKIWNMTGRAPHELDCLKLLPADTVFASFTDFRFKNLWDWLKADLTNSGIPQLVQGVAMVEPMLLAQGIDLNKLLECMDSQSGLIITLSKDKMVTIPADDKPVEIPEPAAAYMLRTSDTYLFDLIKQKLPGVQVKEEGELKKIAIPLPPLPVPIDLKPQIVQAKNRIFLVSNDRILSEILNGEAGGSGLATTEEFQRISRGIPSVGNGFRFISPRLGAILSKLQQEAMMSDKGMPADVKEMVNKLSPFTKTIGLYGVTNVDGEGFRFEFNSAMSLGNMVMVLPAVMVTGIAAAIAIPSYMSKKEKAQTAEKQK
jgi:hypothetical protein